MVKVTSRSGPFGKGRVHHAAKLRWSCRQLLYAFHSCLAEEFAESLEADRIRSPHTRPGSLILHNQEAICHGQQPSQEQWWVANEVQGVCHENSIDRRKVK